MSDTAVRDILHRIDTLDRDERELLERLLAEREEAKWRTAAEQAREEAKVRGIDQTAIDLAVQRVRYPE